MPETSYKASFFSGMGAEPCLPITLDLQVRVQSALLCTMLSAAAVLLQSRAQPAQGAGRMSSPSQAAVHWVQCIRSRCKLLSTVTDR